MVLYEVNSKLHTMYTVSKKFEKPKNNNGGGVIIIIDYSLI